MELCHLCVREREATRSPYLALAGADGRSGPLCKYAAALAHMHSHNAHKYILAGPSKYRHCLSSATRAHTQTCTQTQNHHISIPRRKHALALTAINATTTTQPSQMISVQSLTQVV